MAACVSSKSFKKKIKDERSQYYLKILTRACENTNTALVFILSQSKKTEESRKYKGHVCQGFLNGEYVGEGFDDDKGTEAKNDCANQIIESILCKKIVVENRVLENLSALLPPERMETEPPFTATPQHHDWGSTRHRSPLNKVGEVVQKAINNNWGNTRHRSPLNKAGEVVQKAINTGWGSTQHRSPLNKSGEVVQKAINDDWGSTRHRSPLVKSGEAVQKAINNDWGSTRHRSPLNKAGEVVQKAINKEWQLKLSANLQSKDDRAIKKDEGVQGTVSAGQNQQPFATNRQPKIPESNIGCQMLRKMGWMGGGLGTEKRKGIEEPIVVNPVYERHGIGMTHDYQPSTSKYKCKKHKVQPVITHKFIQKFKNSDKREIVITEPLIQEDHRLLQKLCDKKRLSYEFVPPFNYVVIRKPTTWESSKTGQAITRDKKRNMERQISQIRKKTSHLYNKQTHPSTTASSLKGFEGALPSEANELSNVVIKQEPLHNPTTTELVMTTRHPTSAITTAFDLLDPHSSSTTREIIEPSYNMTMTQESLEATLTSALTKNVNTCYPLAKDGHHTFREPTKAEMLDTLHEFGLGDDIKEIFYSFLNSSEVELEITRNLTSKERLILYRISDVYGFHFMLFSHNKHDKSIVIRKS